MSGGTPLAKRPGLRRAVELVEAGEADVVVVAYFDRLVRSLTVQAEVVERVERPAARSSRSTWGRSAPTRPSSWLSSTMLGLVAEYHRRVTPSAPQTRSAAPSPRGVPPFPNVPPAIASARTARLEPDPTSATAVAEAFRLRADGATVMEVREHLRENGIERSFHGAQALLSRGSSSASSASASS